jgi:hypothetical protein
MGVAKLVGAIACTMVAGPRAAPIGAPTPTYVTLKLLALLTVRAGDRVVVLVDRLRGDSPKRSRLRQSLASGGRCPN